MHNSPLNCYQFCIKLFLIKPKHYRMKRNTTQDCYEIQVGVFSGLVSGGIVVCVCLFVFKVQT